MKAAKAGKAEARRFEPSEHPGLSEHPESYEGSEGLDDPRADWARRAPHVPVLRHRRDGILPAIAGALSVRGETLTCTASKAAEPPQLHPLVQDFLDTLAVESRERYTGRCPEALLLSRYLTAAEANRSKRASRKPFSRGDARRALKHAKITARRIREDGDPWHGSYAPPCRSCALLLDHFGVRPVDLSADGRGKSKKRTRG